jgi:CPA1 family monovalent cation:H+ antiporter
MLFLTFAGILVTLVIQGLSLPKLIQWLGVRDGVDADEQERDLRRKLANKAIAHLEENHAIGSLPDPALAQLKNGFELKIDYLNGRLRTDLPGEGPYGLYEQVVQVQLELIEVERALVDEQRRQGELSDELLRKLENELDLEAVRLSSSLPKVMAAVAPDETPTSGSTFLSALRRYRAER